jgi:hypothetical protein
MVKRRRRFKQQVTLQDRIAAWAKEVRAKAATPTTARNTGSVEGISIPATLVIPSVMLMLAAPSL